MATILTERAALRLLRRTGCAALGLDVSATKIGVAVSDPGRTRGLPLGAIRREKLDARGAATRRVSVRIAEAVAAHGAGVVAVGWPLELSGAEGKRCREVRGFVDLLHSTCGILSLSVRNAMFPSNMMYASVPTENEFKVVHAS